MFEPQHLVDAGDVAAVPASLGRAAVRAALREVAARGEVALPPPAIRESRSFVEFVRTSAPGNANGAARAAVVAARDRLLHGVSDGECLTIAEVERDAELAAPHLGVAAALVDLVTYAEKERDGLARRLARTPFSGISRDEASAIAVVAADRATFAETVARGTVPLGAVAASAAHAFVESLAACVQAFRAQGGSAAELVATAAMRFRFASYGARACAALAAARAEALALDAVARACGGTWQPAELAAALRARSERAVAARAVATASVAPREAEPFARVEPEPAHDVRRKRGHFSASSLGMYASCERRWYYRYVCAAVEDRGSSASFYGSAFHWALERFHELVKRPGDLTQPALERDLDAWIGTAFARYRSGFETPVEYEIQLRRARRTGRRYIAWFLARSRSAPFEVVGTETEAKLQLDGYDFIGYIDRLDRDDRTGGITVVDYKTGSIAQSAREYRRNVSEFVDFQLPFYYWARTAAGERVTRLALIPLKDASRDVEPVELEVVPVAASSTSFDDPRGTIGIDELTRARAKMIEHARRLTDGTIDHFGVTRDPETCGFCPYANACRDRPLAVPERFGR